VQIRLQIRSENCTINVNSLQKLQNLAKMRVFNL